MSLTPEERRRIYEEEKARIEAQEQIRAEMAADRASGGSNTVAEDESEAGFRRHVINSPSWAALCLNFPYLLSMRLRGPALLMLALFLLGFVPLVKIVSGLVAICIGIYYATVAKRMAWKSRSWADFDDFLRCQRIWDGWAKAWAAFVVVVTLTIAAVILSPTRNVLFNPTGYGSATPLPSTTARQADQTTPRPLTDDERRGIAQQATVLLHDSGMPSGFIYAEIRWDTIRGLYVIEASLDSDAGSALASSPAKREKYISLSGKLALAVVQYAMAQQIRNGQLSTAYKGEMPHKAWVIGRAGSRIVAEGSATCSSPCSP